MLRVAILAQSNGPDAVTILYLTLLFIFVTAIVTAIATKWARDKCLKLFRGYQVTLERNRGQTLWGRLKVFSAGIEVVYDHPYIDPRGVQKTSFMFYQQELDTQVLSLVRCHDQQDEAGQRQRLRQVQRTFNPGFFRRLRRAVRNVANTLRDAFNAAIGAAVAQYQRINPATAPVLATQGGAVSSMGQTLLGRFANAYEPLLEQYIGQPVILEVADPINPSNVVHEYTGYLADYTQQFIALFNVEHAAPQSLTITLPDVASGEALPPLPPPPPLGAPPPSLSPPLLIDSGVAIRVDGARVKIQNTRGEMLAVRRLEREGFEPVPLGMVLPPMATLNLPARDARSARLVCDVIRAADIVAPRKFATVRHAGILLERRGLMDEFALDRLPLVAKLFSSADSDEEGQPADLGQGDDKPRQ